MSFISSRNKDLGNGIIEVLCGKSPLGVKKQYVFRNKRANNLKTFWYILKKRDTRLEILALKNWGNFQVCHSSIGGPEKNLKHRF